MGSIFNKTNIEYIGELSFEKDSLQMFLPCEINQSGVLNIILSDLRGKSVCKKQITVDAGKSLINFDCTNIQEGHYNVWIEVNGQTYLRKLSIQGVKDSSDFVSRLKKWL
jgi:hypothetical protein